MNPVKIDSPTNASAGSFKLKELLRRYNMPFEERREGNTVVIDIKARSFTQKAAQLFTPPQAGLAGG